MHIEAPEGYTLERIDSENSSVYVLRSVPETVRANGESLCSMFSIRMGAEAALPYYVEFAVKSFEEEKANA